MTNVTNRFRMSRCLVFVLGCAVVSGCLRSDPVDPRSFINEYIRAITKGDVHWKDYFSVQRRASLEGHLPEYQRVVSDIGEVTRVELEEMSGGAGTLVFWYTSVENKLEQRDHIKVIEVDGRLYIDER